MNKIVLGFILILFGFSNILSINAQANEDSVKALIIGNWRIENLTINGVDDPDFNPEYKDLIILRKDGTHITTDNEYEYEQKGKWCLEEGLILVLTSDEENDTQKMEIIFFENNKMRLKLMDSENDIIIYLVKEDEAL
ncbi:MAG: lipocalin family protein [Bacteroidetes bacterium]|nr:lipocalin family protein [Bacteroidota bacterium]